jgi:hypothetical protein
VDPDASRRMTLHDAIRIALMQGCELEPVDGGRRVIIRAIAYDADPYELDVSRLLLMQEEEFVREWIPARYEM